MPVINAFCKMKKLIFWTVFAAFLAIIPSCKKRQSEADRQALHTKLMTMHQSVNQVETDFFNVLDSVNKLREAEPEYHDSIHASAIGHLTNSYNGFVQKVFDALGQTAAMTKAGSDAEVDAFSVYLLALRKIAEADYARMVYLTSLRLDAYGEEQYAEYTQVLDAARLSRENIENELKTSLEK
jgi:hypothetical protein